MKDPSESTGAKVLGPLPDTSPGTKPYSTNTTCLKSLTSECSASGLDPTLVLLQQMNDNFYLLPAPPAPTPAHDPTESVVKFIGQFDYREDIFVFHNRFKYGMKVNAIPHNHGIYREAYFNHVNELTTY